MRTFFLVLVLGALGCNGNTAASEGDKGGACYPDDTCNPGLVCSDSRCEEDIGASGNACYPDGTCNASLLCIDGEYCGDPDADAGLSDADGGPGASDGGPNLGETKAFPTATGAAARVTGGRGQPVYHVTNLNDGGAGSFRDATSASNRIVVFDVSGTIELTSDLYITSNNVTIAGQSAPQGGITITGKAVHFQNVDNIILRYLRFRPDYNPSGNVDALNAYNCDNFIVDHCSISWGGDEAFSIIGTSSDVTIQNCILGESATGMIAGDGDTPVSNNFSWSRA